MSIGPAASFGNVSSRGRINALAFDPRSGMSNILYAGAGQGGVFKSTDAGATWRAVTDNKGLGTLAISALAVGPDGTVYAGTGDVPDRASNDGDTGRKGFGVYRSTNGGASWSLVGGPGSGCTTVLSNTIERILIHPTAANTVYAAGDDG